MMFKDKYMSIFSRPIEATVIILNRFCNSRERVQQTAYCLLREMFFFFRCSYVRLYEQTKIPLLQKAKRSLILNHI